MTFFLKKHALKQFILSGVLVVLSHTIYATQIKTVQDQLAKLEASSGGKIGISAIDTGNHQRIQYRAHEHFPMGCT
jgi:hypothetical protein